MRIHEQYLEQARKIHWENPVVDAHFDLAAEVYERHLTGESGVVERRYLPRFEEAGLNIVVSSIFINNRDLPELGLRKALGQITALKEDVEPVGDRIRVTVTSSAKNFIFPNSNTREGFASARTVVAHNRIYHGGLHASRLTVRVEP